jgi:hypothetical protein
VAGNPDDSGELREAMSSMALSENRHLSLHRFKELLRDHVPSEYPVAGEPRMTSSSTGGVHDRASRLRVPERGRETSPEA